MRVLASASAVSLALHVAVGAVLSTGADRLGIEPVRRLETVEIALIRLDGDAIELRIERDDDPAAALDVGPPAAPSERPTASDIEPAIESAPDAQRRKTGSSGREPPKAGQQRARGDGDVSAAKATETKAGSLAMRARGPADLTVESAARDHALGALAPPRPSLRRSRADLGVAVARISPDGKVRFEDRRNFTIRLAIPSRRELGAIIDSWLADPVGTATAATANPLDDYSAPSRSAPTFARGDNAKAKNTFIVPTAVGAFDATGALLRATGEDQHAAKKLAYLEATRDERAQIAADRKKVDLDDAVAGLREHLGAIWARRDLSAKQRRAILFELWDECAEGGGETELQASTMARATITGFIRRVLPRGSIDAYSVGELEELNSARQSRRRFRPYGRAARQ